MKLQSPPLRLSLVLLMMLLFSGQSFAGSETGPAVSNQVQNADSQHQIWIPIMSKSADEVSWNMAGANPQRTSWVPDGPNPQKFNNYGVRWYRPVEAYIGQNVQIVAARDKIYVSTANGLYALNVATGELVWRFDTELPLGNAPTISGGVAFVAGMDRRVYALNADNGELVWQFEGARAGFSTNPLVIDGQVMLGSRDGYFYSLDANNGNLLWQFPEKDHQPLGPILYSAAYKNGQVFFAANDNYAYALNAANGKQVWRSEKMPGDGYQSWWPVVYEDYVIFSAASPYADQANPGTFSLRDSIDPDDPYYALMKDFYYGLDLVMRIQREELFYQGEADQSLLGPSFQSGSSADTTGLQWDWADGSQVIDAGKVLEYLENDGSTVINRPTQKPWRRSMIVLSTSNGHEYQFDTDGDGKKSTAPFLFTGTKSGNVHPPLVIPTRGQNGTISDVLFANNFYKYRSGWNISRARLHAWQFGTQYVHPVGGDFAIDEPFANSAAGSMLYQNLCCDRLGMSVNLENNANFNFWEYSHTLESIKLPFNEIEYWRTSRAPGYDLSWWGSSMFDGYPRVSGAYGTQNGIYHNHGLQSPIIPYKDFLIVHRSNGIIVLGPDSIDLRRMTSNETPEQYEINIRNEYPQISLPMLEIHPPDQLLASTYSLANTRADLDLQIQKMLDTGHLRPGYYNSSRGFAIFANYFENPGDTLYTLTLAYPHVSPSLKNDLAAYTHQHFKRYFEEVMSGRSGYWIDSPTAFSLESIDSIGQLQPREAMPVPPEVAEDMKNHQRDYWVPCCWPWGYPQHNFYAMWLYADTFYKHDQAKLLQIYQLAKSRLQTDLPDNDTLVDQPWIHNGFITGYLGFLKLQDLAGQSGNDANLRSTVTGKLNALIDLRVSSFDKDTPWAKEDPKGALNIARNFMNLVPESASILEEYLLSTVSQAVDEYESVAPYWFAARYEAGYNEFASQTLYTNHALFQTKAFFLHESANELLKFVDVPAFEVGDLFFIQSLVAVLEAGK